MIATFAASMMEQTHFGYARTNTFTKKKMKSEGDCVAEDMVVFALSSCCKRCQSVSFS